MATAVPCALGLAIAGGYLLAGRVLAPVGAMGDTARRITAESLDARLPVTDPDDEFGRLASVFNDSLSRVDAAFEQLRCACGLQRARPGVRRGTTSENGSSEMTSVRAPGLSSVHLGNK